MHHKKITFHTTIKKTASQQPIETTWCVFASDYNSVQVEFVVSDLRQDELRTVNPTILLVMEDGSVVQRTKEEIVQKNNVFSYNLQGNEGNHTGVVKAQLRLETPDDATYRSNIYTFTILESLDSIPVPKEFVIDDIRNILQEVKHHIEHIFKDESTRKQVFEEFIRNATLDEKQRESWFKQSQQSRASLFQVFMDEAGEVLKDAQQVKDLFDELVDTGIVESNIREKLGELETSYAPRLSTLEQNDVSLTAQLQQTEQELSSQLAQTATKVDLANATAKLNIENSYGNIENIHPKVLYFPNGFVGWKFVMAYTPYPGGATIYENPSVAVSRDGVNWKTPQGTTNPLSPKPAGGYNSDTHLVIKGNSLEVWWRRFYSETGASEFRRRTTTDFQTWTEEEVMFSSSAYGSDLLSPSLIYEGGKYRLWGISGRQIRYNESTTGKTWDKANERTCAVSWGNIIPWHMDIIITNKGYEAVIQGYVNGVGNSNNSNLYYINSLDNVSYTQPVLILKPSNVLGSWDNQGIYRSSIVMVDNEYFVYYSAISKNNERAISLSSGEEITNLRGFQNTDGLAINYKLTDQGMYLPKYGMVPEGIGSRGTYLRTAPDLDYTIQVLGEKKRVDSGAVQIGSLYFDDVDQANSESLPMAVLGQVRRNKSVLEFYNGNEWVRFAVADRKRREISGTQTIDLDIGGLKLIVFNGSGTININSITGGTIFEETTFIIDSSNIEVVIPDSSGIVNPGRTTVTLNTANPSCKVMRMASSRWRTY